MFQKSVRKHSYTEGVGWEGGYISRPARALECKFLQTLFAHKGACTLFAHHYSMHNAHGHRQAAGPKFFP